MWTQLAPSLEHGMQQSEKASQVLKMMMMMMMMSAGCSRIQATTTSSMQITCQKKYRSRMQTHDHEDHG